MASYVNSIYFKNDISVLIRELYSIKNYNDFSNFSKSVFQKNPRASAFDKVNPSHPRSKPTRKIATQMTQIKRIYTDLFKILLLHKLVILKGSLTNQYHKQKNYKDFSNFSKSVFQKKSANISV